MEVTRDRYKHNPIDQVHLHYLIDTQLTKTDLIEHLRAAMNVAKVHYALTKHDYITNQNRNAVYGYVSGNDAEIDDKTGQEERFEEEPKKKKHKKRPILFKEGLRIQKVYYVGKFWLDVQTGEPTNVEKMWEPMRQKTKEKNAPYILAKVPFVTDTTEPPPSTGHCPHHDDRNYHYCGQYDDCGQYQECRLEPPEFSLRRMPITKPSNKKKKSPLAAEQSSPSIGNTTEHSPIVIFCPHFEFGDCESCEHNKGYGEYQECGLIPSESMTEPQPAFIEQPNASKKSPLVRKSPPGSKKVPSVINTIKKPLAIDNIPNGFNPDEYDYLSLMGLPTLPQSSKIKQPNTNKKSPPAKKLPPVSKNTNGNAPNVPPIGKVSKNNRGIPAPPTDENALLDAEQPLPPTPAPILKRDPKRFIESKYRKDF